MRERIAKYSPELTQRLGVLTKKLKKNHWSRSRWGRAYDKELVPQFMLQSPAKD
ncbi:unnamed protein product [Dovyalis caffra]|uniref:Uncharacterized protein n=1 Tax=Dovyalis caffra TaxID=77055 RepID=A0AAV1RWD9_9ROSI|nr:unnamed protein product [Dovyalis caffra]